MIPGLFSLLDKEFNYVIILVYETFNTIIIALIWVIVVFLIIIIIVFEKKLS